MSLYPELPYDDATNNKIIYDVNTSRINEMNEWSKKLDEQLTHYNKILHRLKNINTFLFTTGLVFLLRTTAASCGLGVGVIVAPTTLGIIAGVGGFGVFCNETFKYMLVRNKINYLKKKIKHIEKYMFESYYLFQKITDDKIITLEEIQTFRKLEEEYTKQKHVIYEEE